MLGHDEAAVPAPHEKEGAASADQGEHRHSGIGFAGKVLIERA
jgi:hypothetical protein